MPPRVCSSGSSLVPTSAVLGHPVRTTTRAFTTTTTREKINISREQMFQWFNQGAGRRLAGTPETVQYVGYSKDQPFPLNPLFRSQRVLSEAAREHIWTRVVERGEPIKSVSADMNVDVRRVAAVVRMKEVEKQWVANNKKLATPYSKAIMKMLPQTHVREGEQNQPHESINDILVHKHTMAQLFLPVSESRHFTRADAAKAFHDKMLPADTRSPQAELIDLEREVLEGATRKESMARFREVTAQREEEMAERIRAEQDRETKATQGVRTDRYEFRFKEMKADDVGKDGRKKGAIGWRYGAPFNDRKRGLVKIPTSVP